jgi:hypothetical protein
MLTEPIQERREHERAVVARPCKLYDPRSGKYVSGMTCNISSCGAMIRADRPMELREGDRLFVGIALRRSDSVLRRHEMAESVVLRALKSSDGCTALAVRFVDPVEQSPALLRDAA